MFNSKINSTEKTQRTTKELLNSTKKYTKLFAKRAISATLAVALVGTVFPYMDNGNIGPIQTATVYASAKSFTAEQQARIDTIVRICIDNYDTYGVLPSVCLAQAMVESTMGEHCRGYNLWGIKAGAVQYSSLEEGTIAYLKVINNGYYSGAPFCKDPYQTLTYILDGGYCVPVGNYYQDATKIIQDYNLTQYDQKMYDEWAKAEEARKEAIRKKKEALRKKREAERRRREEERRRREEEARQKRVAEWKALEESKMVQAVYDPYISDNIIVANESVASAGAVYVYCDNELQGVYTVVNNTDKDVIRINNIALAGKRVSLYECMIPSNISAEEEEEAVEVWDGVDLFGFEMPSINVMGVYAGRVRQMDRWQIGI